MCVSVSVHTPCIRVLCFSCLVLIYMEPTTMSEEIERESAHPNTPAALPQPAYRRRAQACPPHARDPTAGVRDGMATSCGEHNSKPTTAAQVGLASWTARRQSADGRQDTRSSTQGLACDEREGEERERLGPPDQPKPTAKSHKAWPVVTELAKSHPAWPVVPEPQCALPA